MISRPLHLGHRQLDLLDSLRRTTSVVRLAEDTGQPLRRVRRALRALHARGLVWQWDAGGDLYSLSPKGHEALRRAQLVGREPGVAGGPRCYPRALRAGRL